MIVVMLGLSYPGPPALADRFLTTEPLGNPTVFIMRPERKRNYFVRT